jgi:hypothetical protein
MLLAALLSIAPAVMGQGIMDNIMGEKQTGIFGSGKASAPPGFSLSGIVGMLGPVIGMLPETTGGSGPYKSFYAAVPGLAKHTLYQPKSPPAGQKLPVIVCGACFNPSLKPKLNDIRKWSVLWQRGLVLQVPE